ncbi:hypothetical protein N7449_008098 [Penicillium cf. viridicatum]|uniref:Uncharacterized protein n=1 Tax=Penicillium cf. viridicatum TaxID=2972119 RepID=A0A9W9MDB9_9EURO|nr:hypothetical protein N7449_008098 [Penicillium cf. viridicatum]
MGLNDVDASCIGTQVATGPSTCAVSLGIWGDGGREGWREEEEEEEEEEEDKRKGNGCPFIPSTTRTFLEWDLPTFLICPSRDSIAPA